MLSSGIKGIIQNAPINFLILKIFAALREHRKASDDVITAYDDYIDESGMVYDAHGA